MVNQLNMDEMTSEFDGVILIKPTQIVNEKGIES
jgi:hypothetical protein